MDDEPLAIYIREVCQVPSLTAEEEALLRVQLTDPGKAENAKVRLLESHLREVISIAERQRDTGVHVLDLIQAGNKGLLAAANTFAQSEHPTFLAHATPYIEGAMTSSRKML